MTPLVHETIDKRVKLLGMLGSRFDGEIANAGGRPASYCACTACNGAT